MIDTTTFLLTQDSPSGPIIRLEESRFLPVADDDEPNHVSVGGFIASVIAAVLLLGTGAYLYFAL